MGTEKSSVAETPKTPPEASAPSGAPAPAASSSTAGQNSDSIRRDIEETRARMDATFDELSERLSPRHILDDIIDLWQGTDESGRGARKTIKETGARLGESIRTHPVPSALIGAGLAWLFFEEKKSDSRAGGFARAGGSSVSASSLRGENISQDADSISDMEGSRSAALGEQVREKSEQAVRQVRATSSTGAHAVGQWLEDAPLAAGVAALAAGLAVGLFLPGTRTEDELMGSAADVVKGQARAAGSELAGRGAAVAERSADAALGEVHRQTDDLM